MGNKLKIFDSFNVLVVDDDVRQLKVYERLFAKERPVQSSLLDAFLVDEDRATEAFVPSESAVSDFFSGMNLAKASQGQEAIDIVASALNNDRYFSVVFLDMRMPPGIDGLEAAKRIRQLDPNVYIVFVTAFSDFEVDRVANELVDNLLFVHKPFQPDELKQIARNAITAWHRDREMEVLNQQLKRMAIESRLNAMKHEVSMPIFNFIADKVNAQSGLLNLFSRQYRAGLASNDSSQSVIDEAFQLMISESVEQSELISTVRSLLFDTDEQSVCSLESLVSLLVRMMPELVHFPNNVTYRFEHASDEHEDHRIEVQKMLVVMISTFRTLLSLGQESLLEGAGLEIVLTLSVSENTLKSHWSSQFESSIELDLEGSESQFQQLEQLVLLLGGQLTFIKEIEQFTVQLPLKAMSE